MSLPIVLFLVGLLGFILNQRSLILLIICIELILLSVTLLLIIYSWSYDDVEAQTYSLYILAIAGAESAIGLGIIVTFYKAWGFISISISKAY